MAHVYRRETPHHWMAGAAALAEMVPTAQEIEVKVTFIIPLAKDVNAASVAATLQQEVDDGLTSSLMAGACLVTEVRIPEGAPHD